MAREKGYWTRKRRELPASERPGYWTRLKIMTAVVYAIVLVTLQAVFVLNFSK